MRIIVHFGMYKTGTSSIQETLYHNRYKLNLYYPDFGTSAHNNLNTVFREKLTNPNNFVTFQKHKERILSKLKAELDFNATKQRDFLLSAEVLTAFNLDQLKNLYSVLSDYSENIIAVGYIRAPKAFMESAFQQTLKGGKVKTLNLQQRFPKYQTLFEKFDQVFGVENVYFWSFDPSRFPNGCVVRDFCQRLEINITADEIIRVNEGLSLNAASLLYAYAKYRNQVKLALPSRKHLRSFIKLLSQLQGKKLRFSSEIIAPQLELNRTHIDWMEKRMGISLTENLSKDDSDAIGSDAELLTFIPNTLQWLAEQLGGDYISNWHPLMTAEEIGQWLVALQTKLIYQTEINSLIQLDFSATRLLKAQLYTYVTAYPKQGKHAGLVSETKDYLSQSTLYRGTQGRGYQAIIHRPKQLATSSSALITSKVIFAGYLFDKFGHFLLESLSRLWVCRSLDDCPIIWLNAKGLNNWQQEILTLLGIKNPSIFITQPTQLEELVVPEPGYVIRDFFSSHYAKFLGVFPQKEINPKKKVWLSRSLIYKDCGGYVNEEDLEIQLERYGWIIFHPQQHSVTEQLEFLADAANISGTEGSAFHILLLFNHLHSKVQIVSRCCGKINENHLTIAQQKHFKQTIYYVDKEQIGESLGNKTLYRFCSIPQVISALNSTK